MDGHQVGALADEDDVSLMSHRGGQKLAYTAQVSSMSDVVTYEWGTQPDFARLSATDTDK